MALYKFDFMLCYVMLYAIARPSVRPSITLDDLELL